MFKQIVLYLFIYHCRLSVKFSYIDVEGMYSRIYVGKCLTNLQENELISM